MIYLLIEHLKNYFVKNHSNCTQKYFEVDNMLEFFRDSTYKNQDLQQSEGISMGTGAQLVPIGPVSVFIWSRIYSNTYTWKTKSFAVAFDSAYRYIDDVLSVNNCYFYTYGNSIYSSEFEKKNTTESVSYFIFRYVNGKEHCWSPTCNNNILLLWWYSWWLQFLCGRFSLLL